MAVAATKQEDKLIQFPGSSVKVVGHKSHKQMKTNSLYKEDGVRKAAPADPLRSKEEFQKIVDYLANNGRKGNRLRNKTLFILGCMTGLRCGDVLNLHVADVYKSPTEVKSHIELIEEKTFKRNVCKIPKAAQDALIKYAAVINPDVEKNPPLFISEQGTQLSLKSVYRILNDAGKACGLDLNIGTHTMRKTYAHTALVSAERNGTAGKTLEMLQMKLNHSDARITMRYCKAAQDKIDKMSDSVSDWLR